MERFEAPPARNDRPFLPPPVILTAYELEAKACANLEVDKITNVSICKICFEDLKEGLQ